jgi:hypothetical protein
VWGGNVNVCTSYQGSDMSQANCASTSATMPPGDVWAPGANTAARLAAAGYPALTTGVGNCVPTVSNSCFGGANMNAMESALGIVSQVRVQVAATSAAISYLAPDTRACSVDISPNGVNWTRQSDSGGVRPRSVIFTGLSISTAYQYRVLCYFDQSEASTAGWFSFASDTSNLQTAGAFTTLATGASSPSFAFSVISGSTAFRVALTSLDGITLYANTCSTSPCVVSSVPVGDYSMVQQWLAGSTVIAASDSQPISFR